MARTRTANISGELITNTLIVTSTGANVSNAVVKTGDTMTGELNVANNLLITGNVGIGTANSQGRLQIDHNAAQGSAVIIINRSDSSNGPNGSLLFRAQGTTYSGLGSNFNVGDSNGNIEFLTGGINTRMVIDSSGNVSIGTTNATAKLDVIGSGAYNDTENGATFRFTSSANTGKAIWGGFDNSIDMGFIQATHRGVAHKNLLLNPNGGAVGIGNISPNYKLHVSSTLAVGNTGFVQQLLLTENTIQSQVLGVGYSSLGINTLGGNVGIGTASTTARLEVGVLAGNYIFDLTNSSEGSFKLRTYNHGTGTGNAVAFTQGLYYSDTENASIRYYRGNSGSDGFLGLVTNGLERIRITTGGSVGIGTTNPATKFHLYHNGPSVIRTEGVAFSSPIIASLQASDGAAVFVGAETNHRLGFLVNNVERGYFSTGGNFVQSQIGVGNLASSSIADVPAVGTTFYNFTVQGDDTWRTLVSNFNDRQGYFFVTLSDAASGDVAAYSFNTTSPAYGVSAISQIFYNDGGWNTGSFGFQLANVGGTLALQVKYASYYSSSNLADGFIQFVQLQ